MTSLVIRSKRPGVAPHDWSDVPPIFRRRVSAVVRNSHEAEALIKFFGASNWVPDLPVLLLLPTGPAVIGWDREHRMTAKQLRDQAMAVFEHGLDVLKRSGGGGLVMRERGGPLSDEAIRSQIQGALIRQSIERQGTF